MGRQVVTRFGNKNLKLNDYNFKRKSPQSYIFVITSVICFWHHKIQIHSEFRNIFFIKNTSYQSSHIKQPNGEIMQNGAGQSCDNQRCRGYHKLPVLIQMPKILSWIINLFKPGSASQWWCLFAVDACCDCRMFKW